MKIAYFLNTFNYDNWGSQATSHGVKYLLNKNYPDAEFIPMTLPNLPYRKIKLLRKYFEFRLYSAIMNDDINGVYKEMKKFSFTKDVFSGFSHICFNGEGAMHSKSGHVVLLMALLYIAKKQNRYVVAINQTIDFEKNKKLALLVQKVYNIIDFVSVREPLSVKFANTIGINNITLIPDAVYGLPVLLKEDIIQRQDLYELPNEYLTFTGSSALKRDKKSLEQVSKILSFLRKKFNLPIVFMANAKTDIWLAHKLQQDFELIIIEPPVKYEDAMAIIAMSKMLIGGRQHPNIFAYIYETLYVPFDGNSFKNLGVVKLQNYPLKPLAWECSEDDLMKNINLLLDNNHLFKNIKIKSFKIFKGRT